MAPGGGEQAISPLSLSGDRASMFGFRPFGGHRTGGGLLCRKDLQEEGEPDRAKEGNAGNVLVFVKALEGVSLHGLGRALRVCLNMLEHPSSFPPVGFPSLLSFRSSSEHWCGASDCAIRLVGR